ncbi:hypothetical protein OAE20_06780 [Porticoccaceae bacterium]|nr:hypothetical protein [Porticoccaceae bacterium]
MGTGTVPGPSGFDGNSSLWKSIGVGPFPSGGFQDGYFFLDYNVTTWGNAGQSTHQLIIHEDDGFGNNFSAWFKSVEPGDIVTIRNIPNQNESHSYEVLPMTPSSSSPPFNNNGPWVGFNNFGGVPNTLHARLRLRLINATSLPAVNGGPFTKTHISFVKSGAKGEMGLDGADGADGADGVDGNSSGAVGVSFSMDLRGTPTVWAASGAPPATVSVDQLGPYILYTGEDSINNGIIPRLPKNFEFIHLEGNSWASAPNPNPGYFPSTEWVQSVNRHVTSVNNHKLPQLGPTSNGSLTSYNNFYGFRVPQDGKMVGFQINYIQSAMTGQFYAMYYKPDSENPVVIFNKGGPLVGGMNNSGPISTNYASGNAVWDETTSIPVKANGFIFVMSDLSCRLGGPYTNNWNSQIGPGPAVPFRPPSGKIHATVYVTYD